MVLKRGFVSNLEKAVHFKRGKARTYKKDSVKLAHLHHVLVSASKGRDVTTGEDPKRFPLRGGNLDKKFHLVSWDIVCSSKEEGGMGIRSLSIVIRALLGK